MRKYRVTFYSYYDDSFPTFSRIFFGNTTFIINRGNIFSTTILNNIYNMLPLSTLKIKGNKNEIDNTQYDIYTDRGVYVIAKEYL
jgi:hypothetical protein